MRGRGIAPLGGDAKPVIVRRRSGGVAARLPGAAQGEDNVALVMDSTLDECFRRAQAPRRASRARLAGNAPFPRFATITFFALRAALALRTRGPGRPWLALRAR